MRQRVTRRCLRVLKKRLKCDMAYCFGIYLSYIYIYELDWYRNIWPKACAIHIQTHFFWPSATLCLFFVEFTIPYEYLRIQFKFIKIQPCFFYHVCEGEKEVNKYIYIYIYMWGGGGAAKLDKKVLNNYYQNLFQEIE